MAQGAVAMAPAPSNGVPLTAEELREILEYDKIVQFRDSIFAGTHPRIRIPAHLTGKQINTTRNVSSPSSSTPRRNISAQLAYPTQNIRNEEPSSFFNKSPNNQRSAAATMPISSKSEINPILLEKSDDLIKAEIQLQRQRLERGLREQIEQQRIAAKALLQTSESLPNFDLSEVLSKALEIVHPSTATEAEPSVGARSSASDSFDENTFYSSQHDTPAPSVSPQAAREPVEVQSHSVQSVDERPTKIASAQSQVEDREVVVTGTSLSNNNYLAAPTGPLQAHSQIMRDSTSLYDSRVETSNSDSSSPRGMISGAASSAAKAPGRVTNEDPLRQAFDNVEISPVMRAHNLSPLAPQPSRVSPLATAREPPILRDPAAAEEVQPAQVAALRAQVGGLSSTDSSPKGKGPEKKKEKKKKGKRKAKDSVDTPESPYIKPEPRSPSPYAVAPLPRPQKRQRQTGQYAAELNYDEPRYDPEEGTQGRAVEPHREAPIRREYEQVEERFEPEIRRPEPAFRRIESDDAGYRRVEPAGDEYRHIEGGEYVRKPQSPTVYALPYSPTEMRPIRAASHAVPERRFYEEPRYYREPAIRASVRPDADRERSRSPDARERRSPVQMLPPPQPLRLVIDEYGRKFYEPIPPSSLRQSVAPPIRYREPEVVYERAPARAVSGRAPTEIYEDEATVYRRPSPSAALPRRVVTQPEYAMPSQTEHRAYRQREYSVRPSAMAPAGEEYVQIRGAPERRQMSHFEEAPREYVQRAPSARPEAVRYEVSREYVGRLQSVRPAEVPSREYAASVRPEARRELAPQAQREFSVRPVDAMSRREPVAGHEGERYYEEIPSRRPAEIAFIERPRARESSVLVYADDVRREVYR